MKAIERLSVIRHKSKINNNWKHKELFRILRKNDIWIVAYQNIKSNKIVSTSGITKETFNTISLKRLERLREKVVNESYLFKGMNAIKIPELNSRKKPLGLPIANYKIVQEVTRMILKAIYEPCFSKQSFGFRQGLGTHDALEYLASRFRWVDWVIKSDIEREYLTVDYKQLYKILSKKIQDVKFINLIYKLLKPIVLQQMKGSYSNFYVPQESILFSIIADIYYNEFDKWLQKKRKMLKEPRTTSRDYKYKQMFYQIYKIRKYLQKLHKKSKGYKIIAKELKILKKERAKISSLARKCIQIEYVRYANHWMIGISGNKVLVNQLRADATYFIKVGLKQKNYSIKTKVTDLRVDKAKFLGYEIYLVRNREINPYIYLRTRKTLRTNPQLGFDIPIHSILKKMEERGYIKKSIKGYRSISKVSHTVLEDILIVAHFTHILIGLVNYYSGCTNLTKLQSIHYFLYLSCAMTLSHRHRSSMKKIFAKYGKSLNIYYGKVKISFPYQKEWFVRKKTWQHKRKFVNPFQI